MKKLLFNTVTPLLKSVLEDCMQLDVFDKFRLVGGTALSLQLGHRKSDDIDLFTDEMYDSIDFQNIDNLLKSRYQYLETLDLPVTCGKSYYIGTNEHNAVKLDLYYTDPFITEPLMIEGIRLASKEEIVAMKMDVILRGGRRKDYWDIHELTQFFSFDDMISLHGRRYPYADEKDLRNKFLDFKNAEDDFDPKCLKSKDWAIIKLDLIDFVKGKF